MHCCLLLGLAGAGAALSPAAVPPVMVIERGRHAGNIKNIACASDGSVLATLGNDNSVRVWKLPDLTPLVVLRPAFRGTQMEAFDNGLAVTPDGRGVAVSTAGVGRTGGLSYYKLSPDRQSADLSWSVHDLPVVARSLAFSADGRLAAAMGHANVQPNEAFAPCAGIRVYGASDGRQLFDTGRLAPVRRTLGGDCYTVSFGRRGSLAFGTIGGHVEIRDKSYRLTASADLDYFYIFSLAFSPDESHLVAGTLNVPPTPVVIDSKKPSSFVCLDGFGCTASLESAAWTANGESITAATEAGEVRVYDARASGYPLVEGGDLLTACRHILTAPSGFCFCGSLGFGVVNDKQTKFVRSAIPNFLAAGSSFGLSAGAKCVRLRFGNSKKLIYFTMSQGLLNQAPKNRFEEVRLATPTVSVADIGTYLPRINGHPVDPRPIDQLTEAYNSYSIAPDSSRVAFGTSLGVSMATRLGQRLWHWQHGDIRSVCFSPEGEYVCAFGEDGQITFLNVKSGVPFVSLYLMNVKADSAGDWLLYSPSGYYNCSPGADEYFGWLVSNGQNAAASFFPSAKFARLYFRPNLVARAVTLGSEAAAIASRPKNGAALPQGTLADHAPPVVTLLSVKRTGDTAVVSAKIASPASAPFESVACSVGGIVVAIRQASALKQAPDGSYPIEIALGGRTGPISLVAQNRFATSDSASEVVAGLRTAGDIEPKPAPKARGRLVVLAIGVGDYADEQLKLHYCQADADAFVAELQRQNGFYSAVVPQKLTSREQTTRESIIDNGFAWLVNHVQPDDTVVLYLSGHGGSSDGFYYFLPSDYQTGSESHTVEGEIIFDNLQKVKNKGVAKIVVVLDTCHAESEIDLYKYLSGQLATEVGAAGFSACEQGQSAQEGAQWGGGHGAFTYAFLNALRGQDSIKSPAWWKDLSYAVRQDVLKLTDGKQRPDDFGGVDFPVFKIAP